MLFGARWKLFCRFAGLLTGAVLGVAGYAADTTPAIPVARDVLFYKDGDRVQGKLLRKEDGFFIFRSDRFGELRVPDSDAVFVPAEKANGTVATAPAPEAATPASAPGSPQTPAEKAKQQEQASRWEMFYPWVLTAKVRNFFGPWHGKFEFSDEDYSDAATRNTVSTDAHLQRKWKNDEVDLNARYDYSRTDGLTTTDLMKADGSWRHDFPDQLFATYRPTLEWNRDYFVNNVPADYVLLQQEIGVGYNLINTPANQLRAGVSENIFSNWGLSTHDYVSHYIESVFVEASWKLPWRMTLTDRNVYYYSLISGHDGWENKIELNKKLTETLSVGIRGEDRHNNPDLRQANYRLLRFFLGFDF